ncbi:hypothetical protein FHC77_19285 [Atlantibacter hermannii]|uniref:hypothetical protein n=1 Tax=Atlantibacter hermannii TaxID=565 RepID=UPI001C703D34|nr:hypothetical protein [Atlantibacter hermannii]MBW9432855.1 hypothetical protein [Atlantibacter hermannii]
MTMTAEQLAQTIRPDLEMLCSSEELTSERREALARIVEHLTPPNLLALLDELERKDALIAEQDKRLLDYAAIATKSAGRVAELEKKTAFLKEKLAQLANFNPDWDMLEATTDSLREHMSELTAANKRIAELEARTVTVKLPTTFWYEHDDLTRELAVLSKRQVKKSLKEAFDAAGINLTVEG